MNAERLHALVWVLHKELKAKDVGGKLDELTTALEQLVNNPHPEHQQILAKALTDFREATSDSASDNLSPTWREVLDEIGADKFVGTALQARVNNIIERNQITLAVALSELKTLQVEHKEFRTGVSRLVNGFDLFDIGKEELAPGQCEIGMLIPRKEVGNELPQFAQELKDITFILDAFSEVATGSPEKLSIKTVSSSELLIYLEASLPFAACLAVAVERLVALYKQLLEIKQLRTQLIAQAVPEKQMAGIEEYANTQMNKGIDDLSVEIVQTFYKAKDAGRRNELTTKVRISLKEMANRIDRGYNVEVRVEPPSTEDLEGTEGSDGVQAQYVKMIQSASKNMQFLKQGGAPILRLSEKAQETTQEQPAEKPKPEKLPKKQGKKAQAEPQ